MCRVYSYFNKNPALDVSYEEKAIGSSRVMTQKPFNQYQCGSTIKAMCLFQDFCLYMKIRT
jgi:hypothetical protein